MKRILIIIFLIGSINLSFSQKYNGTHNKKKNTLIEFNDLEKFYEDINKSTNEKADINTYTSTFGYLLLVESTGKTRKVSDYKLNWLTSILKSLRISEKAKSIFENEVEIKTENGNYWFPIQKQLFRYWVKEMNNKTKVLIYIRTFGSINRVKEDKWLFTINSFNSDYYDGLWEEALESFNNNDAQNGISCLKKMMDLDPKDGRNYSMYGYYFYDKGYPEDKELLLKADSLYTIAEKLSPDYSYGYYQKALAKFQLGEYTEAWKAIDKAKSLGETRIEDFIIERFEKKLPYAEYLKLKN